MKLTISLLLVCVVLCLGATNESSYTANEARETPSLDGIMGFGLEILLTKLEHIDHKLMELQLQINHLEEEIGSSQCTYGKTSTSTPRKTPKSQQSPFTSCKDIPCTVSGVYLIRINNVSSPFAVYCEMDMFAGGWIVVQHRFDGSVDFYRKWKQYRDGFGDLDGEFWLGLEHIHQLTKDRKFELLVEMKDFEGNHGYARYDDFQVGSESEGYSLKILGSYSGTAGDGMEYSREKKFSTKDRHNDGRTDLNFAVDRKSGWWHSFFGGNSNLNGLYGNATGDKSNWWWFFKNDMRGLSYTRMMIRES